MNDTIKPLPNGDFEVVPCKTHPDAPHGFDRNASHSEDRYVCECEYWEPEPVTRYSDIVSDSGLDPRNKFDTAPPKSKWVGLTEDDLEGMDDREKFIARVIETQLRERNTDGKY